MAIYVRTMILLYLGYHEIYNVTAKYASPRNVQCLTGREDEKAQTKWLAMLPSGNADQIPTNPLYTRSKKEIKQ